MVNAKHRKLNDGEETRCPFYMRLGRPHRRVRKISSPSGFDLLTLQTVAQVFLHNILQQPCVGRCVLFGEYSLELHVTFRGFVIFTLQILLYKLSVIAVETGINIGGFRIFG